MRNESHKTFIGIIRRHVVGWRKREGWSRETVVQAIVEAHEQSGGPDLTGIRFEPTTRDAFERMKVNADRVFRWLDDETKDSNLLPANFAQSILMAMPMDVRLGCIDEFLCPLGLTASGFAAISDLDLDVHHHLCDMIKESGEAIHAFADLMDKPDLNALERARKEIAESIETNGRARRALDAAIARAKAGFGMVVKLTKRSA
jgi:hypothetical protein